MKKTFRGIGASIFASWCIVCLGWADASAQTTTQVRAAYIPVVTWLPAWVAKDKGIFASHGLDVSLTQAQNPGLLPGTLGKQFDVVPSTPPDLIKAVANGLDVLAVAGGFIESSQSRSIEVIVRSDSGIKTPADLSGKLIASGALGSLIHVATIKWLQTAGVPESAIRAVEVPFPNMADQLKNGRVDAVEAIQPFVGILLKAGFVSIGDPALAIANPTMGTIYIADADWARSHKPVVDKWIASLEEAAAFIKANPQEARAIVAKYTKLPAPVVSELPIPAYEARVKASYLASWVAVLRDLKQIQSDVPENRLLLDTN